LSTRLVHLSRDLRLLRPLDHAAVAAATKAEEAMAAQDAAVEKAEAARNSLESAIYRACHASPKHFLTHPCA
jgi:hypothetical protein